MRPQAAPNPCRAAPASVGVRHDHRGILTMGIRRPEDCPVNRLRRSSSGLRHLRWAREVRPALEAHAAENGSLSERERDLLGAAIAELGRLVAALSVAVKPYRDFLERERVKGRGRRRLGAYLCLDALDH